MALCTAEKRKPAFPKMMGLSTPRGHTMSLTDMGPAFADPDQRYVLTVDAEVIPFAEEAAASKAWAQRFADILK